MQYLVWIALFSCLVSCLLANRYLVVLCSGTVQSVIRFPHYRQVTKGAPVIKPRGVEWRLHNPISPRTPPPGCILPPGGIHSAPSLSPFSPFRESQARVASARSSQDLWVPAFVYTRHRSDAQSAWTVLFCARSSEDWTVSASAVSHMRQTFGEQMYFSEPPVFQWIQYFVALCALLLDTAGYLRSHSERRWSRECTPAVEYWNTVSATLQYSPVFFTGSECTPAVTEYWRPLLVSDGDCDDDCDDLFFQKNWD